MCRKTVLLLLFAWHIATAVCAADKRFILVIDAGHGGHDAGALGAFSKEKNINLNVALAFGRYVESNCPDVKVVYTRKTDVFIPLHERATIANRNKANLFVSIHTNALPKGRIARGLETYTLGMGRAAENFDVAARENSVILIEKDYKQRYEGFDPRSSESYIMFEFLQDKNMSNSVELAKMVQKRACASSGRQNKGVKQAGFLVLRETSMPSCLIELGFITTPDEETYLNSVAGIDALAKGIYQAFADYRAKFDRRITVPYKAETKPNVDIPSVVAQEPKSPKAENSADKRRILSDLAEARDAKVTDTSVEDASSEGADAEPQQPEQSQPLAQPKQPVAVKAEEKPAHPVQTERPKTSPAKPEVAEVEGMPVFKVQIMTSSRRLDNAASAFKGLDNVECYEEGGLYKYTYGASSDYNEISRMRKNILDKYPEAFVVAFKNGHRMNVAEAIREFKNNGSKR